jgi:hypothetical protein
LSYAIHIPFPERSDMTFHHAAKQVAIGAILLAATLASMEAAAAGPSCPAGYTVNITVVPLAGNVCECDKAGSPTLSCSGGGNQYLSPRGLEERQSGERWSQKKDDDEYFWSYYPVISGFGAGGALGGGVYLGGPRDDKPLEMHLMPGMTFASSQPDQFTGTGDNILGSATVFRGSNSGVGYTDSTGASGQATGYKISGSLIGGGASIETRKLFGLSAGQSLILGADVNYLDSTMKYDLDLGSVRSQSYGADLYARYFSREFYWKAMLDFDWGTNHLTDNSSGSPIGSSYGSNGIGGDFRIGKIIPLWGNGSQGSLKDGGSPPTESLLANISGHIGYTRDVADGFTDSTGTVYGDETERYWIGGGRIKLTYYRPDGNILWAPFVAGTIDRQFNYSHTAVVAENQYNLAQEGTIFGAEVGVKATTRNGTAFGLTGFTERSANQNSTGLNLSAKVPF